jgi:hypothetical protein
LICLLSTAGCVYTGAGAPTQQHPSCSWNADVPTNADQTCAITFRTLSAVAAAEVRGDNDTIRRIVPAPAVAGRIIAYGASIRARHVKFMHVVPNVTLQTFPGNVVIADLNLIGRTKEGLISRSESVYLQFRHGQARILKDQPGEEW